MKLLLVIAVVLPAAVFSMSMHKMKHMKTAMKNMAKEMEKGYMEKYMGPDMKKMEEDMENGNMKKYMEPGMKKMEEDMETDMKKVKKMKKMKKYMEMAMKNMAKEMEKDYIESYMEPDMKKMEEDMENGNMKKYMEPDMKKMEEDMETDMKKMKKMKKVEKMKKMKQYMKNYMEPHMNKIKKYMEPHMEEEKHCQREFIVHFVQMPKKGGINGDIEVLYLKNAAYVTEFNLEPSFKDAPGCIKGETYGASQLTPNVWTKGGCKGEFYIKYYKSYCTKVYLDSAKEGGYVKQKLATPCPNEASIYKMTKVEGTERGGDNCGDMDAKHTGMGVNYGFINQTIWADDNCWAQFEICEVSNVVLQDVIKAHEKHHHD